MRRFVSIGLCMLLATSALADNRRAAMAAQIEAAGRNEAPAKRHAVEIDGCIMTTFVWKPYKTHGFQLWSSWRIDLRGLDPAESFGTTQNRFLIEKQFVADGQLPMDPSVRIFLRASAGWMFRHEIPMSRAPVAPYQTSPREGVEDYVYQDKNGLMIWMQGPDVVEKAQAFTEGLIQYRADYCQLIG
ncbi:hypothetical protein [Nereida sp. MMG025]|uniref:hypothetical protein n=1 Tax=Nereida sp. MMG025 TaxID=2909981 RepID=UPI001F269B22|nr:hypothetical protein [Nereida sp. MMG025]MCF6443383.1 hypothetical protein [Nereida sp. MMG025]